MKKKLSLLLVLILILTTLIACSSNNIDIASKDEEERDKVKQTLTVQVEKDWKEYYKKAAKRVKTKYPDMEIKFIEIPSLDHLELLDGKDKTNNKIADLFAIPIDRVYSMSQNNVLGSLDAKTIAGKLGGYEDYDNTIGGKFKINDEYLAFPMNIEVPVNFVNTKNAKKSNINLEKPIEFTELNNETMLLPFFNAWFGISFINSANIELLGKDEQGNLFSDMTRDFSELDATEQEIFKALFNYWKEHKEENTPLFDKEESLTYIESSFKNDGKTSIILGGPWSRKRLSKLIEDEKDIDILALEQVVVMGSPLSHWKAGWGLSINSRLEENIEKKQLAEAMVKEIVDPKYAVDFFKATGKILANIKIDKYMDSDLEAIDKKLIKTVYETYEKSSSHLLFEEWDRVWPTWENAILSWNSVNPSTEEEAYRQLQNSFKEMIKNLKENK